MTFEAKRITKSYGGKQVLRGIDLAVEKGSITGVIGPSGGGKTTLLRTLAMITPADSGSLILEGESYDFPLKEDAPPPKPWPRVTAVFQQFFLWPHLTLRDNILLPLKCRGVADPEAVIAPLVEKFGMTDFIGRYPNQVSGGQQQRAALARALALQPDYILLDEITSALDVEQAGVLLKHLLELREAGIGILLITHHLGFLHRAADRICFIEQGQVIESGGRDLLDHPETPRLKQFLAAAAD